MTSDPISSEEFRLIDEVEEAVLKHDRRRALTAYMKLGPQAKDLAKPFLSEDIFIETDPNVQEEKIRNYLNAKDKGDEIGMKRHYNASNEPTKKVIDDLIGE